MLFILSFLLEIPRATTPGDSATVYCLLVDDEPIGTTFAIANNMVLTAYHNLDTDFKTLSICKFVTRDKNNDYVTDKIIVVKVFKQDSEEDWAILVAEKNNFSSIAVICRDNELPEKRGIIGIRDYEVGMFSTDSRTKLEDASSGVIKVAGYENRVTPPSSPGHLAKKVKVVENYEPQIEDSIVVEGGRVSGSCGAPYFATNGKVVAFHVRSINDASNDSVSQDSHLSKSVGLVLCRLPVFWAWYESNVVPSQNSSNSSNSL